MASKTTLDWDQIADRIEKSDDEAFASLLGLEFTYYDEMVECKNRIVYALRFTSVHEISWPPPVPRADILT